MILQVASWNFWIGILLFTIGTSGLESVNEMVDEAKWRHNFEKRDTLGPPLALEEIFG